MAEPLTLRGLTNADLIQFEYVSVFQLVTRSTAVKFETLFRQSSFKVNLEEMIREKLTAIYVLVAIGRREFPRSSSLTELLIISIS